MAVTTVESLRDQLRATGLVDSDTLSSVAGVDPAAVVQTLVDGGALTEWQGREILQGLRRDFFLDRYRLLDLLGEGSVGAVYKAQDERTGRMVAIKVLFDKHEDRDTAARFQREMEVVSSLEHPNIISAYDAGKIGDQLALVMEYVDGRDVEETLEEGIPPVAWSCEVARQTALGLQCAHEHGYVHRDIKPRNILVTGKDAPKVKILDMGLARVMTAKSTTLTRSGQVLGTIDYIAPEQASDAKNVDIRADIYSLGCTLFQLLTGQLPFPGGNAIKRFFARTMSDPPLVTSVRKDLPEGLDQVVARMAARDREQRFQTPAEVAAALQPFCHSAPAAPQPAVAELSAAEQAEQKYYEGVAHFLKNEFDEAIAAFSSAIDLQPRMAKAFFSRAKAHAANAKLDQAIALQLDPKLGKQ